MTLSFFGNLLLIISIVFNIGSIVIKRNNLKLRVFFASCTCLILTFIILLSGFIYSDFSIKNVFLNSSLELSLTYKMAASWASHEGSFLLWIALLSIVGGCYLYRLKSYKLLPQTIGFNIAIISFIYLLFTGCLLLSSNPFESFSFVAQNGLGLNPMLQDVALSIHPPILYLGNVCLLAVFTGATAILYSPQEEDKIAQIIRRFNLAALIFLTVGIGLGAWWAYRELGWGGYWFFDAVENISILPWLCSIALHHSLIAHSKNRGFLKWIISLSFLSFLMVVYGTFIVRSGIITSVHAFAFSPERGLYIFSVCLILTISSLAWFAIKVKKLSAGVLTSNTRESVILLGNILWLFALVSLIVSLIYPIYCYLAKDINASIDPEYFYQIFIPIFVPILILAALAPCINKLSWYKLVVFIAVIIVILFYINGQKSLSIISGSIIGSALFVMFYSFDYIYLKINNFTIYPGNNQLAIFLSHFGFGALAFSIALNQLFAQEVNFTGKIGSTVTTYDMSITLENLKYSEIENYYRQIASFKIEHDGNLVILKPENRLYKVEGALSQEADIFSFLLYDYYAVLSKIDKSNISARIYYQPFMSFIWLSLGLISLGFMLALTGNSAQQNFAQK